MIALKYNNDELNKIQLRLKDFSKFHSTDCFTLTNSYDINYDINYFSRKIGDD